MTQGVGKVVDRTWLEIEDTDGEAGDEGTGGGDRVGGGRANICGQAAGVSCRRPRDRSERAGASATRAGADAIIVVGREEAGFGGGGEVVCIWSWGSKSKNWCWG